MEVSNLEKELSDLFKTFVKVDIDKLLETGESIDNKNNVLRVIHEFLVLHILNDSVLIVDENKIKEIRKDIFNKCIPIALSEIEAVDFEGVGALTVDELVKIAIDNIISDILQLNIEGVKIKKLDL